ncbi:PH domain-containing protein [Krasilnikoviella flava]|uniref:PH domain-containing protein n=1 Tax=Krasilnikoviella flava TaxID=526729 RepID=A0A1T5KRA2_9MICO|nr:PH domain-containing protein [Krasilnikoviella flava]SKC66015.1 PH domain-containing protein [Krasilnikoviella flava]
MITDERRERDAVRAHAHLRRYVLPNERVIVATRHHWAQLLGPIATTAAAFLLIGTIVLSTPIDVRGTVQWLWVAWFVVAARLAWKWLEWRYEWFVATDKRLLLLYGLVVHKVAMMPMKKVTDMGFSRSPTGQVLGYGRFDMESAGQDQALRTIKYVPHPDATYRTLCDTLFTPGGPRLDDDDALPGPGRPADTAPGGPTVVPGRETSDGPRPTTQPIAVQPAHPAPRPPEAQPSAGAHPVTWKPTGATHDHPRSDGAIVPDPFL